MVIGPGTDQRTVTRPAHRILRARREAPVQAVTCAVNREANDRPAQASAPARTANGTHEPGKRAAVMVADRLTTPPRTRGALLPIIRATGTGHDKHAAAMVAGRLIALVRTRGSPVPGIQVTEMGRGEIETSSRAPAATRLSTHAPTVGPLRNQLPKSRVVLASQRIRVNVPHAKPGTIIRYG